jgi:hypothetical protein
VSFRSEPLFRAEWTHRVLPEDCLWSLEDGERLLLHVEKASLGPGAKASWWASAFKGETEIDVTAVDSSKKLHEYDEETRSALRKIMYDRSQQGC